MGRKRHIANLALVIASILVAFFFVEIGLRLAGVSYPSFYTYDEYCGASLRPGTKGWWRKEGSAYIVINSAGQRDREHTRSKPANTVRVAVLGDSYVEALQLPMKDTFWAVLERELGNCLASKGQGVEVLNFGVSGYGTAQELMTLRHRVWDYSPDIVILAFVTGNDIRNNSRVLEGDPMRPYFVYKDGVLSLDDSFRSSSGFRMRRSLIARFLYGTLNYSRLLQIVNEVKNILSSQFRETRANKKRDQRSEESGLDDAIYEEPRSAVWREAWRVTEWLIVMMHEEVTQQGGEFWVITFSNGIQVHPNRKTREEYARNLGVSHLLYPDFRVKALCDREHIHSVILAPVFRNHAEKQDVYLHGFPNGDLGEGHWNATGHYLAGKVIASELCKESQKINR